MVVDFVPVVVRGELLPQTLKWKAPADMTVAQLVEKIRSRIKVLCTQACHLVSKEGSIIVMSQNLSHVYRDNRSDNGLLHFTCVTESVFGCPPPSNAPIQRMFPELGALPFDDLPPIPAHQQPVDPLPWLDHFLPQQNLPLIPAHQQPVDPLLWLEHFLPQQQETVTQVMNNHLTAQHNNPPHNGVVPWWLAQYQQQHSAATQLLNNQLMAQLNNPPHNGIVPGWLAEFQQEQETVTQIVNNHLTAQHNNPPHNGVSPFQQWLAQYQQQQETMTQIFNNLFNGPTQ